MCSPRPKFTLHSAAITLSLRNHGAEAQDEWHEDLRAVGGGMLAAFSIWSDAVPTSSIENGRNPLLRHTECTRYLHVAIHTACLIVKGLAEILAPHQDGEGRR
jgi:hypothetical protein